MTVLIPQIQSLYDQNRFLEAFDQSANYWKASQPLDELSSSELILAGRLATRLGGPRLSRWLYRAALKRNPLDAQVRYFTQGLRRRGWKLFEELRSLDANPDLEGADPVIQASWLASGAVIWASLRDFARAKACIERAKSLETRESWVFSCESNIFRLEDKRVEALRSAEIAWEMNPGTPYGAHSLGESLVNLQRIREAADRLSTAAEGCESHEVAHLACWHACTLAETLAGEERSRVLGRAEELAEQTSNLAVLADRETRGWFARSRLDIAQLKGDHAGMERWANEVRSPFHRKVLENLRKRPDGLRICMPFRWALQKHGECLPTSVASALAAMGTSIEPESMAAGITFGGTAEWRAAGWLEERGFAVRFFVANPEIACRLIKNGIAFVVTLESDANAHAVAVVGLDEAARTLIVHDPSVPRKVEYLLESFGKEETPIGPKGMAVVSHEKLPLLDRLLSADDVAAASGRIAHHRALLEAGPGAAREVAKTLAKQQPEHPVTRLVGAMQDVADGRVSVALIQFQELMKQFPGSAFVRARLLGCCRSLGDTALMRRMLASVVERGILPGVQSQQIWLHPPGAYVSEYADLLRESADTREQAWRLLNGALGKESSCAQAWHVLADMLWDERDLAGAVLGYRIAACLETSNEHYARAYSNALGNVGRIEEGLASLEKRAKDFGKLSSAVATWSTWIKALEDWGYPERALNASVESLRNHGDSPELLSFVVPFLARMGHWEQAEGLLRRLEKAGNVVLFHNAAADFYLRRGEIEKAYSHAEAWVQESPLSIEARRGLLQLLAKKDGTEMALKLAAEWFSEHPGHDDLEQLYSQYLEQTSAPQWKKYAVLRRRVKRNPEDGWAWREIAFNCVGEYESKGERGREKLNRRVPSLIEECERTTPRAVATLRLRAKWCEARGQWVEAVNHWMDSIKQEPHSLYSYQQVLECLARFAPKQRKTHWDELSNLLLTYPGHLDAARETILLVARRLGTAEAEDSVLAWKTMRPDDPEITEAYADLLLVQGHGRTDAQRALDMLQPAIERFPYHPGLRFSLADAHKKLGEFDKAEQILDEIVRRHPGNPAAQIQLARVHERHGRTDEALRTLAVAAIRDPQNVDIRETRARILLGTGRDSEARRLVDETTRQFARSVPWREKAIQFYSDSGDDEAAVRAAREGVNVYPRGAYLWFLLGRTLHEKRHFAGPGEAESCLRRALELNHGLFVAGDSLARLLVEHRRYDEAKDVMRRIAERLRDPSPARGRLAWIHRERGDKQGAREEMVAVLREVPWYGWGWNVLMGWLTEDKSWAEARSILRMIPTELRTNTQFRWQRLLVLEKAGLPATELDLEWESLLRDFPEEVPLHLHRYDSLRTGKRMGEAAKILESIRTVDRDSPFVLARFAEVLASDRDKNEQSIDVLLQIMFEEKEESTWPAEYAWKAVRAAKLDEVAYGKACDCLRKGAQPTLGALSILSTYAVEQWTPEKRGLQPYWRNWFPDRGAREVLGLLKMVDQANWSKERYRARLIKQLNDAGYKRLAVKYWKKNKAEVEFSVETWAETARALVALKRKREARNLLADWRGRTGVEMWVVANYVTSFTELGTEQLEEVRSACHDALARLRHDHCAKYLVHREAEACALLGDEAGVLETWKENRGYLNGQLDKNEWFESKRKYLLAELPGLACSAEENDWKKYRKLVKHLRWQRIIDKLPAFNKPRARVNLRWWWVIWILFMLVRLLLQHP
jgi:tetratricopeptide (TPR) repeat protein